MTECFFDTYAIIEIVNGNPHYEKFTKHVVITTKLNLFEVFYILARDVGKQTARNILEKYYKFAVDYGIGTIAAAAELRLANKPHLSMTDCIGYKLAEFLGIKFLTGDDWFKDMPNVEFVK